VADPKQQAYGQAGGRGPTGQGFSRFDIGGDPTPYFPVWAAGSLNLNTPAQLLEARGGAYRYGKTKVGGVTNLYSDGAVLRAIIAPGTVIETGVRKMLLGGTGAGNYDCISNGRHQYCWTAPNNNQILSSGIWVNGEVGWRDTTGAANIYGGMIEGFTFAASTVTATNGSDAIVATLANAFAAAATLTGPYAYTPSFNNPRVGDLIEIVDGGVSRFFRFKTIAGANATIFPNYNGTGGAGLTYRLWRSGYGSWSSMPIFYDNNDRVGYYAGLTTTNQFLSGGGFGTIQAVRFSTGAHYNAPQTVDALGAPVADLRAVDVTFFKGFLLYGFGNSIGWSAPGFPNGANPFDTLSFPSSNVAAINTTGNFLYYRQIGDQVLAFFEDCIYLVQATGVVPEFTVYKLPELSAPLLPGIPDPQGNANSVAYTRPSAAGRGTVYYESETGLMQMAGLSPKRVSVPVETYDFVGNDGNHLLEYDRGLDGLVWTDAGENRGVIFQPDFDHWMQLDLSILGNTRGMAGVLATQDTPTGAAGYPARRYRQSTLAYWLASDAQVYALKPSQLDSDTTTQSVIPWTWATPIICLGQMQEGGFNWGGFAVIARGAVGGTPSLTWTVYTGTDPYSMAVSDTGSFAYTDGPPSSRRIIGTKVENPYVGVVITGSFFIELAGIGLYDAANMSAR
jgi:hypothetical protein